MSDKIIQSYVWHKGRCFFVSTINRESSAMLGPRVYAETIVWEWDDISKERGEMVGQDEGMRDDVSTHLSVCRRLALTGLVE